MYVLNLPRIWGLQIISNTSVIYDIDFGLDSTHVRILKVENGVERQFRFFETDLSCSSATFNPKYGAQAQVKSKYQVCVAGGLALAVSGDTPQSLLASFYKLFYGLKKYSW